MKKKKILFVNEASFIASGFGTYGKEVISRLHNTNKYNIAEFASYGHVNDPQDRNIHWRYYANAVKPDDPRNVEYHKAPANIFGLWRFDRVLLDFKPDIVIDIRDPWMLSYQALSPLRPYFHLAWMPTCDSRPQREEWIEWFIKADGILTYSDWAHEVFQDDSGGQIKLFKSAPPCANSDAFFPIKDKVANRRELGIDPNINIVGTVMRNQKRKLYPDLFQAFKLFLTKCYENNKADLANKTFLYCHTSYPDMGWNLPRLIKEYELGHKILFTYMCRTCQHTFATFFQDARAICPACNNVSAVLPNVSNSVSSETLGKIMNLFDFYIQYAICEGAGMPAVEAASCGIPIAEVDYSAMADIVRKLKGYPLKVLHLFRELETDAYRATPCNQYCANTIYKFLNLSHGEKQRKSAQTLKGIKQHYQWDNTANVWEQYIDAVQLRDLQGRWDAPINLHRPNTQVPPNLTNEQFVRWCIDNILGDPAYRHSLFTLNMVRDLNHGARIEGRQIVPVQREDYIKQLTGLCETRNTAEKCRCGQLSLDSPDFIEYANLKDNIK